MKDIRIVFNTFLDNQEISSALTHTSIVTNTLVDQLKYSRIDRYDFSMLTSDQISKIMGFTVEFHEHIDIYFAFGQLCIGYLEPQYGKQKRLPAFAVV